MHCRRPHGALAHQVNGITAMMANSTSIGARLDKNGVKNMKR
jgi:hypothetical protein